MKAIFFFIIFLTFLLISSKPIPSSSTRINHNRRILHQPFFPINSLPPTSQVQPPLSSPSPQQKQPKYPFSSLSPPNNKKNPFFPLYPNSPPQPPSTTTTLPTFPANISSLILPPSVSSSKPISKKLVAVAVSLSLLSAALISGVAAALLHHRRHPTFKESRTDSLRLFPPNTTPSDGGHRPPGSTPAWSVSGNSSEFLLLGTLRGLDEDIHQVSNSSNAGASSGYRKLGSPELHPLPPLPPRHSFRRSYRNSQVGYYEQEAEEEEEEFFSPRGSSGKDQSPDAISQRGFHGVEAQNSRTASYSSSISASPIHSLNLSPRSLRSKSPDSLAGFPPPFRPPPAIPLPPPPPPPRFWEIPVVRRGLNGDPITGPPVVVTPAGPVEETQRPKLKPLHWDKVRASSDRAMVWDQLKSSSFQLNEEMIETLFMVNASSSGSKDNSRRLIPPMPNQENRVLDPKKSQNIAILLRALNVTIDEVCEALLEGSAETLGAELLESLLKMAPTNEEERKLKEFKDKSPFKLGPAEKFLKAVLDIPFAFKRVDAMLYIANFDSEVEYLKRSFETLEAACKELKNSRMFLKLLEAVLKTGNRMNVGTNRGDAHAFKLDTLLKLVDIKGADGKTTLLHFVVQEISRAEGSRVVNQSPTADKNQQHALQDDIEFTKLGLQVVSDLSRELTNVKKAAAMDSDMLSTDATKLARGIGKVNEVLKFNEVVAQKESFQKFSESMNEFLKKAEAEIVMIQAQVTVALSLVKEITEYFHGNSAKEEAHPFRIFMVVRDFLSILDQVCKEVGKINERSIVSSARQVPLPVNSSLPPVFPGFNGRPPYGSSDDETSSP